MTDPWLSQEQINKLCEPLIQHAAQIRYMRRELGLTVKPKRNGAPLVLVSNFEEVLGAKKPKPSSRPGPNMAALEAMFKRA